MLCPPPPYGGKGVFRIKGKNIFGIAAVLVFVTLFAVSCDLVEDVKNQFKGTWRSSEGYMAFFEDYS
jgi:hypothetical protein